MSMESEVGSIGAFCVAQYPAKVYVEKMPQDFQVPAIYFPPPSSTDSHFTSRAFEVSYVLSVKVFHPSEQEAFRAAERIATAIRAKRRTIPLLDIDGGLSKSTRKTLYIESVNTRSIESGSDLLGAAQVTIEWQSRYLFELPQYEKMMHVYCQFIMNENG